MDTLVNISQFLLSLSFLIILHEMGHFFPARWFKTRVEKFYLFFDFAPFNSLFKIKKGDTEYGIGWVPLGGYVKISGMVDESMDTEAMKQPPQPWEFRSKPAWQRLIIMVGGVTVNFILGFFIFAMLLWQYGKEYIPTAGLQYGMAFDSLLIKGGLQNGDQILKIGDQPFDRLEPGTFIEAMVLSDERAVTVRRDGQQTVVQLPENTGEQITSQKIPSAALIGPRTPFEVQEVVPGKPADEAGLQPGDRVIAINGQATPFYDQFMPIAQANKGKTVELGVLRGGDTLQLPLTLTADGMVGVARKQEGYFTIEREKYSLAAALPGGVQMGVDFLNNQLRAFGQMFRGKMSVKDNLGSVISIGKLYGTSWDWERFWGLTASLSILLAFMNLLPIPALDGGYVVFLLWEVVTGRKVSDAVMERAVTVGFFLLIGLMIYAFGLDIWRHFLQQYF